MNRYYTVLLVPEREKGVRSFRLPRLVAFALAFFTFISIFAIGILTYDYLKIMQQVYRNKHLSIENRQLKEQIQLFQMKINALTEDLERIRVFEEKLKVITGLDIANLTTPVMPNLDQSTAPAESHDVDIQKTPEKKAVPQTSTDQRTLLHRVQSDEAIDQEADYLNLKNLYEQKIASEFGQQSSYAYTKEWTELSKQSFSLAGQYALFDYKYNTLKNVVRNLESEINQLDQSLLDRESFLRSTPSLIPANGWITSYYGPRLSPYAGRVKMHEGIDVGANQGKYILATADGVVTYAGEKPGFGNFINIDHGYGIETVYAHAQRVIAKKGQVVKRGDLIATVGNTGYSTGPHVHYEVRVNETPVDPLYFILD